MCGKGAIVMSASDSILEDILADALTKEGSPLNANIGFTSVKII